VIVLFYWRAEPFWCMVLITPVSSVNSNMNHISSHEAWQGTDYCRTCSIRQSALFQGLTESDFERIHAKIDQRDFKPGEVIFSAGNTGLDMFTVRVGLVKLVQYLPDGSQRIVRLLRSTDVMGLESMLGQPYHHHAVALLPTEVCSYPAASVKTLSLENPHLYESLLKHWQRALDDADKSLTQLSTGTARQRIARLLIHLASDDAKAECYLFNREDVGSMLAITTETASRIIADFKRKGLITETRQHHFHCDIPALLKLSA
jgi:CRP-like cAMP-binding protein